MQTLHIRSHSIADKAAAKAVVQYLSAEQDWVVYITEGAQGRSLAQNALYWGWLDDFVKTDVNDYAGHDKDHWHREFKDSFLSRIFERDDPQYALTMRTIRQVYREQLQDEALVLRKAVVDMTSTRDASVKQFAEYLTEIERHAAMAGIALRTDAKLYAVAMGGKR